MIGFTDFLEMQKKIRVEVPPNFADSDPEQLDETTRAKVGNYTARRDPPHFQGEEYHAHAEVPGGFEVAWGQSGTGICQIGQDLGGESSERREAASALAKMGIWRYVTVTG